MVPLLDVVAASVPENALRALRLGLILLCVGGVTSVVLVVRERGTIVERRLAQALAVSAAALTAASLAALGVGDAPMGSRADVCAIVEGALGATLAVAAVAASRRPRLIVAALPLAAALAVTPAAGGHAWGAGAGATAVGAAHVAAAAAWTGGLAFVALALAWARVDRWTVAARVVPRFSAVAGAAVAVVLVAGTVSSYLEVRTWHGLWETRYGVLLLVKIGLVLPLLALGAYNRRYAVPRLAKQLATPVQRRRFLRAVGAELALAVVIVAVTGVLAAAPPARLGAHERGSLPVAVDRSLQTDRGQNPRS